MVGASYFHFFFLALFLLSLLTSSIASCNCLSANLAVSMNPRRVFPNEFGPAEVMVSLPTFLILILASAGISSSSSESESWLNAAATDPGFLGLSDMDREPPPPPPPPSFIANGFVDFLKENADDDSGFGEVFDQGEVFEDTGAEGGGDGEGEFDGSLTNFGAAFEGGGPGGKTPEGGGGGGPLGNDPGGGGGGGAVGRIPGGGGGGGPAGGLRPSGGGGGGVTRTSHRLRPLFAWINSSPPSSDFLFLPPPLSSISSSHLTHTLQRLRT